jgi:hypothetical protein
LNPHLEVLTPEQQIVLREVGTSATQRGFYLGGGAALGIYLGHRQSVDLDWFTGERIENPLELAKDLQGRGVGLQVGSAQQKTLHGDVRGVRVSFFEYRHPLLAPPLRQSDLGCTIASLEDLAAMKLLAVAQRGAKKDFLDIHALARHGLQLAEMLLLFRRKFAVEDVSRVLYGLCYFEDADPDPTPAMHAAVTWDQAKADIRAWVKATANAADGPTWDDKK